MALIRCPECKKKISDQCGSCPNCGYPIKANLANNDAVMGKEPSVAADKSTTKIKKTIFKQLWFWIVVAVVVSAAVVAVIFAMNGKVKPKVDVNGNPLFVELTDEVYTNADEYLGYYVAVKGKVFQNLGDNGETRGIQVWIDPANCEQNMMIHYTTSESFQNGDYVICTGYIKEIHTYTNTYGTELSVPLLYSTDLKSASYIEVMSPTVSSIIPKNLKYEKYGYSVTLDKVEFAENETRLYLTVTNNGNATLYVDTDSSVIVQKGKQYNSVTNYDAEYEEVPYNLNKGATASGIVVFPAINNDTFKYVMRLHSDNFDEEFGEVVFLSSFDSADVEDQPPQTEETTPSAGDTTGSNDNENMTEVTVETTVQDKNMQAVAEVELLAELDESPAEIKLRLLNFMGFSNEEADYGIQNASVDWKRSAIMKLESFADAADQNNVITKQECMYYLSTEHGYQADVVQYALENAHVDWPGLVSNFVMNINDYIIEYTWCINCTEIYGIYESCPFCNGEVNIYGTIGYSKEDMVHRLRTEGFSDDEIADGMQFYADEYFYDESKYKKP